MGYKSVLVSDISGEELTEGRLNLVVRPDGKTLDCAPGELDKLKTIADLVIIEVRDHQDGSTKELYCTRAELNKVIKPNVLDQADSSRGRRSGYVPKKKADKPDTPTLVPTEPEAKAS